jgi:hypothetical protein
MASRTFDPQALTAMVTRALTSWGIPERHVGLEFGVSGACIGNIRRGANHKTVRPDLPRWTRSCEQCGHRLLDSCTLGFPDPEEVGPIQAACECSAYLEVAA